MFRAIRTLQLSSEIFLRSALARPALLALIAAYRIDTDFLLRACLRVVFDLISAVIPVDFVDVPEVSALLDALQQHAQRLCSLRRRGVGGEDRKSTRLNSSH